jgi:hypothetical protein
VRPVFVSRRLPGRGRLHDTDGGDSQVCGRVWGAAGMIGCRPNVDGRIVAFVETGACLSPFTLEALQKLRSVSRRLPGRGRLHDPDGGDSQVCGRVRGQPGADDGGPSLGRQRQPRTGVVSRCWSTIIEFIVLVGAGILFSIMWHPCVLGLALWLVEMASSV